MEVVDPVVVLNLSARVYVAGIGSSAQLIRLLQNSNRCNLFTPDAEMLPVAQRIASVVIEITLLIVVVPVHQASIFGVVDPELIAATVPAVPYQ